MPYKNLAKRRKANRESARRRRAARRKGTPRAKQTAQICRLRKDAILASLERGVSVTAAAEAAGISRTTFYAWRRQDPAFSEAIDQAAAACIARVESAVYVNALKPGGHADRKLFLVHKANYRDRQEVSGPDGGPIQTEAVVRPFEDLTDDELALEIQRRKRQIGQG